jgi:carboxylesterase type B
MGLYDQVLAMQWLRENAERFGADAETLTLFGESAGGGAVSAHLLSPVSTRPSFSSFRFFLAS